MQEQLSQIIQICMQGQDVSNFQIRSILSSLAHNIKGLAHLGINSYTSSNIQTTQVQLREYVDQEINSVKQIFANKYDILQHFQQQIQKMDKINKQYIIDFSNKLYQHHKNLQHQLQINTINQNNNITKIEQQSKRQAQKLQQKYNELAKICEIEGGDLVRMTKCFYNLQQKVDSLLDQLKYLTKPRKLPTIDITEQIEQYNQNQISNSISKYNNQVQQKQTNVYDWIDLTSQCIRYINVRNDKQIIGKSWVNIFGKPLFKSSYSFTIKINRMKETIGLGFVDCNYRNLQSFLNLPNRIWYTSAKMCYDGSNKNVGFGGGFAERQQVTVSVDTLKGIVQWKVQNQVRHSIKSLLMRKQAGIVWSPHIWLQNEGDSITLIKG